MAWARLGMDEGGNTDGYWLRWMWMLWIRRVLRKEKQEHGSEMHGHTNRPKIRARGDTREFNPREFSNGQTVPVVTQVFD